MCEFGLIDFNNASYLTLCLLGREYFSPHLDVTELAAHVFLRSVNNITIERGWLPLRIQWGDNVKIFWEAGEDIYNSNNLHHRYVDYYIHRSLDSLESLLHTTTVTLSSGSGPLLFNKNLMSLRHVLTVTRSAMIARSIFPPVFLLMSLIHSMKIMVLRTACSQSIQT